MKASFHFHCHEMGDNRYGKESQTIKILARNGAIAIVQLMAMIMAAAKQSYYQTSKQSSRIHEELLAGQMVRLSINYLNCREDAEWMLRTSSGLPQE